MDNIVIKQWNIAVEENFILIHPMSQNVTTGV